VAGITVSAIGCVDAGLVDAVVRAVAASFGVATTLGTDLPDPELSRDETRGQYSSTLILRRLAALRPFAADRYLGITERDLFIPMMTYVFGQAQLGGPVALVSLARLRPEFYGLPANPELVRERLEKESIHEVGHTLGLIHCLTPECLMSLSTTVAQVDQKSIALCAGCNALAQDAIDRLGRTPV
jgi:archaemetzincin